MSRTKVKSAAQQKLGRDIWVSIYYRNDLHQPWPEIARTIPRLRRWTLRNYTHPPTMFRRFKHFEAKGLKRAA